MTHIDSHAAARAARALLAEQPPAAADVALVGEPADRGWCWVCHWTLAGNLARAEQEAPPPGVGPIVVVKRTGEALYLGSRDMATELAQAAAALAEDGHPD